jgi:hypothetical protein
MVRSVYLGDTTRKAVVCGRGRLPHSGCLQVSQRSEAAQASADSWKRARIEPLLANLVCQRFEGQLGAPAGGPLKAPARE